MTDKPQTQTTEPAPQEFAREPQAGDEVGTQAATYEAPQPDQAAAEEAEPKRFAIRSNVNRDAIGDKFAERRRERDRQTDFDGSYANPAVLAGKLIEEVPEEPVAPAAEPEPQPEPVAEEPAPAPAKKKLVVRREEIEVDQDELVRLAQIGAGGESYIAEAKRLRDEAEALRKAAAARPTDARESAPAEPEAREPATPPTVDDERAIAERIQFGTPDEAAEAIRQLRGPKPTVSADDVRKVIYEEKRNADLEASNTQYSAFAKENEALFKNPIARGALTEQYLDEVRSDLRDLGYPDDRIPTDLTRLREEHRFHRVNGKKVRDTAALLDDSKRALDAWRGGSHEPAQTAPGKIAVTVDRTERRQAIPHQPARAAVPPQSTTSPRPVQSVRGEAVKDILGKRRKLVIT